MNSRNVKLKKKKKTECGEICDKYDMYTDTNILVKNCIILALCSTNLFSWRWEKPKTYFSQHSSFTWFCWRHNDKDNNVWHVLTNPHFTNLENMCSYVLNSVHLETIQQTTIYQDVVQHFRNIVTDIKKFI